MGRKAKKEAKTSKGTGAVEKSSGRAVSEAVENSLDGIPVESTPKKDTPAAAYVEKIEGRKPAGADRAVLTADSTPRRNMTAADIAEKTYSRLYDRHISAIRAGVAVTESILRPSKITHTDTLISVFVPSIGRSIVFDRKAFEAAAGDIK